MSHTLHVCHPAEWKNGDFAALRWLWRWGVCQGASSSGLHSKRRLFIAFIPFSHVYDYSLPHSRLATDDVEGE
ncbi:unnamed protein product [Spirodela intermedia]|uniref:Uncharacterized protein n=1 Tax=Spirodela intermedia TaxID=51605 RepID=A0A7I8K662_SPIIN|nr:unnamed protein product [Spirodela intermedia]